VRDLGCERLTCFGMRAGAPDGLLAAASRAELAGEVQARRAGPKTKFGPGDWFYAGCPGHGRQPRGLL